MDRQWTVHAFKLIYIQWFEKTRSLEPTPGKGARSRSSKPEHEAETESKESETGA